MKQAAKNIEKVNASVEADNLKFNAGELSFESKLYDFSHKPIKDFALTNLGLDIKGLLMNETDIPISNSFSSNFASVYPECQNLPLAKNWAADGKVTEVLRQLCGDCYLFAASTVLEAHVSIEKQKSPVLTSRQNTLECIKKSFKRRSTILSNL
jgi:hypothetical protein